MAACGAKRAAGVACLAIFSPENLTGDRTLDWIGPAASTLLAGSLATAGGLYTVRPVSHGAARDQHADQVLSGFFTASAGQLELHVAVEDLASLRRVSSFVERGPLSAGPAPLTDRIAQEIGSQLRPLPPVKTEALRLYGQALQTANASDRIHLLEAASQADPSFAPAYTVWAETMLQSGNNNEAARAALAGTGAVADPVGKAELAVLLAAAHGDANAQSQSLQTLSRLTPSNPALYNTLGRMQFARHQFVDAVVNFQAVVRVQPWNQEAWNLLGYAQAFHQDLAGARQSLVEYSRLAHGNDGNALDSLGEVNFFLGDYEAAERYFLDVSRRAAMAERNVALVKAAQARLFLGDRPGADKLFASAGVSAIEQARWDFLTGRRKKALAELEALAPKLGGDPASYALSQLSFWKLQTGDRAEALQRATEAVKIAVNPDTKNLAVTCLFLASPSGSAPTETARAYALMISHRFGEAAPVLFDAMSKADPTEDGQLRGLLAWAALENKRPQDAAGYLSICPLPLKMGDPVFASLVFPRWLLWKSQALQQAGRSAEAQRFKQMYGSYSGDLPEAL